MLEELLNELQEASNLHICYFEKTLPTLFLNEINEHAVSLLNGISGNPGY